MSQPPITADVVTGDRMVTGDHMVTGGHMVTGDSMVTGDHMEPPDESFQLTPPRDEGEEENDLDMTPMVDVTFLLLIFFMVTAAFSLQKSINVPTPEKEESATQARTLQDIEEDFDYIIVEIHGDNTIFVDEVEAPSKQDLLEKLRDARDTPKGSSARGPSNLLVLAHPDCWHETVVMALDAGNAVGMEDVKLTLAEDDGY